VIADGGKEIRIGIGDVDTRGGGEIQKEKDKTEN